MGIRSVEPGDEGKRDGRANLVRKKFTPFLFFGTESGSAEPPASALGRKGGPGSVEQYVLLLQPIQVM